MRSRSTRRADVGVSIVLVLLFGGYALGQFERAREVADRVKCASNLRQLGQAMLLYSNDNKGTFPRTIWKVEDAAKPTWGTPYRDDPKLGAEGKPGEAQGADPFDPKVSKAVPAPNDVTAAIFLLIRTQDITSEVFICPSTGQEKWDFGGGKNAPLNWTNWNGVESLRDHLSYSMNNPYATVKAIGDGWKWNNSMDAEHACMADMNPGTDALLKLTTESSMREMMAGNTANHNRDGQNILYGDGHVAWESSPFVGYERDNIYTYGKSGTKQPTGGDGVVGPAAGPHDSVLLPTALELGQLDKTGKPTQAFSAMLDRRVGREPPAPQAMLDAANKILGKYTRDDAKAGQLTLDIAKDKITLTRGGKTITYDWHITDLTPDGGARLSVTPPDGIQSDTVTVWPDGKTMFVAGSADLAGKWAKQ